MAHVIETQSLSFSFGRTQVVKDLSLAVPQGSIYGFLGPNGAGKSTTIKLILGLLRPRAKQVFLFGDDLTQQRRAILSRTGNLIEAPAVYGHLTARENLQFLEILAPYGKNRIDEVLELVGLSQAADKKVKQFSMGMKQRLGIAKALYHDPELLILDEPVNGLDPQGIHEMRSLFLRLREEGKTLFVSSHLLDEIEKTCTHLGIIKEGAMVYQGPLGDLQASTRRIIHLKTNNPEGVFALAVDHQWSYKKNGTTVSVEIDSDQSFNRLLQSLVRANIEVYDMEREAPSLEEVFMDLTNTKAR